MTVTGLLCLILGLVVVHGQDCSSYTDCSGCTTDSCGWCQDSSECHQGSSSGPYSSSCRDWRWLSYMCSTNPPSSVCPYTNCNDCTATTGCGWCRTDGQCHSGNATGPANGGCSEWYETKCPAAPGNCELYTSCGTCTNVNDCVWCPTDGTCKNSGTAIYCGSDVLDEYNCPTGAPTQCGDQTNCHDCLLPANAGLCSWCTSSGLCLDNNATATGCPLGQLKNETCATVAPQGCAAWTACDACTEAPLGNCGWCNATRRCHEGTSAGPSVGSCPSGDWEWLSSECSLPPAATPAPSGYDCSGFTTCDTCTTTPACGWCVEYSLCLRGNNAGPFNGQCTANWRQGSGSCASGLDCSGLSSCSDCTATAGCGWCANDNVCMPGNEHGPLHGVCGGGNWRLHNCDGASCSTHTSCSVCTGTAGCGWCASTYTCTSGTNSGPTDGSTCTNWHGYGYECNSGCDSNTDCYTCNGDSTCGWCTSTQTCMYSSNEDSNGPDSGYCPPGDWINYEGTCPTPCSDFTDCYDCTTASSGNCGWCANELSCTSGTESGPTNGDCSASWEWTSSQCATPVPPSSDCGQWANCNACTTAPSGNCGWCTSNKLCSSGTSSGPNDGECSGTWEWDSDQCVDAESIALRAAQIAKGVNVVKKR